LGISKLWKRNKKWPVSLSTFRKRMECRYLVGHLLITSACSSKPERRGVAFCAVQVKVWLCLSYSWKTRPVISRLTFLGWGRNTQVKVSQTSICLTLFIYLSLNIFATLSYPPTSLPQNIPCNQSSIKAITYQSENISTSRSTFPMFLRSICFVCISIWVRVCVCVCVCVFERKRERQICYHELKCKSCCRVWSISGVQKTRTIVTPINSRK